MEIYANLSIFLFFYWIKCWCCQIEIEALPDEDLSEFMDRIYLFIYEMFKVFISELEDLKFFFLLRKNSKLTGFYVKFGFVS